MSLFSISKDILLYNYNKTIKIRNLKLIHFYYLILRTRSNFVSYFNKAFIAGGSSSESCIAFSCHFAVFSLEQFLSLSLTFMTLILQKNTAFVECLSILGFIIIRLRLYIFGRNVTEAVLPILPFYPLHSVRWQIVSFCFISGDYFDNLINLMTGRHHCKVIFFLL